MKEINFEKINEDYEKMNENEKLAVRYGAEGRNLSQVIKNSPEKIDYPDKIFDAWDMGVNMRKNGTSKKFLSGIEKEIMDSLSHPNGISDEPLKDIWGNDLAGDYPPGKGETKKEDAGNFKLDFKESEKHFPKENYLLKPQEKYDKMYLANYSNEFSSEKTKDGKTHVTYGCEDENIVGGIQLRLNEMGYKGKSGEEINITGTFDENTEEGIKQFQEDRGLTVTGILDDATKEEMGFAEDYSISRKGKNATPFNHPYSYPFNLEIYNERQEEKKEEKEQRIKDKEEFESLSAWERFWRAVFELKPPILSGVAQGVDMSLRGELQEAEEGDLVTNHDHDCIHDFHDIPGYESGR